MFNVYVYAGSCITLRIGDTSLLYFLIFKFMLVGGSKVSADPDPHDTLPNKIKLDARANVQPCITFSLTSAYC